MPNNINSNQLLNNRGDSVGGGHRRILKFKNQNSKILNKTFSFEEIISVDNLLEAWKEFIKGKRSRKDVGDFLSELLSLTIHPDKIFLKTLCSGTDFLGWIHFPDHRVLRTTTKRRMLGRIKVNRKQESIQSYLELLKHGNGFKIRMEIKRLTPSI